MATKYADIHIKVDPKVKSGSEAILKKIGISMSDLVNMTLRRVIYEKDIPFNTSLADESFAEIKNADGLKKYLQKLVDEDDGARYTAEEVWDELDENIAMLRAERRRDAKVRSRLYTQS